MAACPLKYWDYHPSIKDGRKSLTQKLLVSMNKIPSKKEAKAPVKQEEGKKS